MMSAIETFVVHKEWLDSIAGLPCETQDRIIAEFVRYGCGLDPAHPEDAIAQSFVNILKNRIDYSKDQYAKKVAMGKTATEIATILNISKSSVDHSDGWRKRRESEFVF